MGRVKEAHTLLVDDRVSGCTPLALREDLDGDDVTLHRAVHVCTTDKQDRFRELGHVHSSLPNHR